MISNSTRFPSLPQELLDASLQTPFAMDSRTEALLERSSLDMEVLAVKNLRSVCRDTNYEFRLLIAFIDQLLSRVSRIDPSTEIKRRKADYFLPCGKQHFVAVPSEIW